MKYNMNEWVSGTIGEKNKKSFPILSFPGTQLIGSSVLQTLRSSDLQAQCVKAVADRIDTAAAVMFMDLSVEAECFGSEVRFSDNDVPTVIGALVSSFDDAANLKVPSPDSCRTGICADAVRKASDIITDRPLFAGSIGPFSLAGRLAGVSDIMILCYESPETVELLMQKSAEFIISYISELKHAGANGVIMAEPLTGMLSPSLAEEFSTPYVKSIINAVSDDNFIVVYHNCGNNTVQMIDTIVSAGAPVYHFGNAVNMEEILPHIPKNVIAMGNIDPAGQFRNGSPDSVRKATLDLLARCSPYPNFVLSSGCDIPPSSPWENTEAFFSAVKEFYSGK